ncbi:MAG TPA: hypothetical protein V6C89_01575 [Drouetiella sp.]
MTAMEPRVQKSLLAITAGIAYQPLTIWIGKHMMLVHNPHVREHLKGAYTGPEFEALFQYCRTNGVFKVDSDPITGLIQTSGGNENPSMASRIWVTDTVRSEPLHTDVSWTKAMLTLARFYSMPSEIDAIERSIADPTWYRQGGLTNGVAHIFYPETLERDTTWFNNKRLESPALAVDAMCRSFLASWRRSKDRQFTAAMLKRKGAVKSIVTTIVNLAAYLRAINTDTYGQWDFGAPSSGNWEEFPFPGGLTWDLTATRMAFSSLRELLYGDCPNADDEVRAAIISSKHGDWLKDKDHLDRLIARVDRKLAGRLFSEEGPMEHPNRKLDASLSFVSTCGITWSSSASQDAVQMFVMMKALDALVRPNGMIRYLPFQAHPDQNRIADGYLASNFWLDPKILNLLGLSSSAECGGSDDCSTLEQLAQRSNAALPDSEAEWCWVSVLAEGYSRLVVRLMTEDSRHHYFPREILIKHGMSRATEYINRAYARITGSCPWKSNGEDCKPFAVPEAYEHVSVPDRPDLTTELPGTNTPLAWGSASLYSASTWYARALELIETKQHWSAHYEIKRETR